MDRQQMRDRTQTFAVRIIKLVSAMPSNTCGDVLGKQLLKAGTSIGANYREATHASSKRQFIAMMEIAQREAHETLYWLDLLDAAGILSSNRLVAIREECDQLVAILTTTVKTAKSRAE